MSGFFISLIAYYYAKILLADAKLAEQDPPIRGLSH